MLRACLLVARLPVSLCKPLTARSHELSPLRTQRALAFAARTSSEEHTHTTHSHCPPSLMVDVVLRQSFTRYTPPHRWWCCVEAAAARARSQRCARRVRLAIHGPPRGGAARRHGHGRAGRCVGAVAPCAGRGHHLQLPLACQAWAPIGAPSGGTMRVDGVPWGHRQPPGRAISKT